MSEESIEILVQMAECGEIDPWNIDIVEVTDKFFAELERRRELDLRVSGEILFYSSVLLRIKSECLWDLQEGKSTGEFSNGDLFIESMDSFEDDVGTDTSHFLGPIVFLEHEIDRRIKHKDTRKRPVTLYDLITQLKLAEKTECCRQKVRFVSDETMVFKEPDVDEVVGIAHDESYGEMAHQIYKIMRDRPTARDPGISIYDLVCSLNLPLYQVYIPCLFLMIDGLVYLKQDKFFDDLLVVISDSCSMKNEAIENCCKYN